MCCVAGLALKAMFFLQIWLQLVALGLSEKVPEISARLSFSPADDETAIGIPVPHGVRPSAPPNGFLLISQRDRQL